jgi:hypothetical protein
VTGQERFGNDILRPGMLYLKLKRCPYPPGFTPA